MKIHTLNNSFKFLGVLSALSLLAASCDEHERIDNDIHVGYILCSDGQVVSPDYCEQSGKEAVAVVFHVFSPDENSGDGLAVNLKEQRPYLILSVSVRVHQLLRKSWMGTLTPFPCSPTEMQVVRWLRQHSAHGDMGKVPISPALLKCGFFSVPVLSLTL